MRTHASNVSRFIGRFPPITTDNEIALSKISYVTAETILSAQVKEHDANAYLAIQIFSRKIGDNESIFSEIFNIRDGTILSVQVRNHDTISRFEYFQFLWTLLLNHQGQREYFLGDFEHRCRNDTVIANTKSRYEPVSRD